MASGPELPTIEKESVPSPRSTPVNSISEVPLPSTVTPGAKGPPDRSMVRASFPVATPTKVTVSVVVTVATRGPMPQAAPFTSI